MEPVSTVIAPPVAPEMTPIVDIELQIATHATGPSYRTHDQGNEREYKDRCRHCGDESDARRRVAT